MTQIYDTRYGVEITSKYVNKLENNTVGLYNNSEYNIVLSNNSSEFVNTIVYFDDQVFNNYIMGPFTNYKILNPTGYNQFFKFNPIKIKNNKSITQIKIIWQPIFIKDTIIKNPNYKKIKLNNYFDEYPEDCNKWPETMLSYDKRIINNHEKFPSNVFTTDLSLGISSNKYKQLHDITFKNPRSIVITLVSVELGDDISKIKLVDIQDKFSYYERAPDIPRYQYIDTNI